MPAPHAAFSLVELLAVLGVITLLLALVAPSAVSLHPARKTAAHELKGFLEHARGQAIARGREVYVAFADDGFPNDTAPYRAYAAFVAAGDEQHGHIHDQEIEQISEWRTLPEGIVFVGGEEFETVPGARLRTVMDAPDRRAFPVRGKSGSSPVKFPFLLFSPAGRILVPAHHDADALHVGIAEGHFERAAGNEPVLAHKRSGSRGDAEYAQAECIALGYYSGRGRILTD